MAVKKTIQEDLVNQDILNFAKHKEDIRLAAEQAKDIITREAIAASQTIGSSAELAAKTIASAAEIAVRVVSVKNADDHDLLIELKVGNQFIRDDIQRLSSGISTQISDLQKSKADKVEFENLEKEFHGPREERLRIVEAKSANYMITMALVMIAIATAYFIILTHVLKP